MWLFDLLKFVVCAFGLVRVFGFAFETNQQIRRYCTCVTARLDEKSESYTKLYVFSIALLLTTAGCSR